MKRAFFTVVWSVVFVFTAALAVSMPAALSAGDDPAKQSQAAREAGERWGVPTVFGSMGLAILLGATGRLPGTGTSKPPAHAGNPAVPTLIPPPSRPMAPLYSQIGTSEHRFTWGGFLSRWNRMLGGIPVFLVAGLCVIGSAPDPGVVLGGLVLSLAGLIPLFRIVTRFVGIRWVRLDPVGVTWGGLFGSRHREWGQIHTVNREESILNRRYYTSVVRLEFAGGGSVSFDQTLSDFDTLAGTIQAVTGDLILPHKWDELRREGEARFGRVKLRPDGITMKGKFFSWNSLGRYRIENGHLVLYSRIRPRSGGDRGLPLSEIPNYGVLLTMMRDGGAPQ